MDLELVKCNVLMDGVSLKDVTCNLWVELIDTDSTRIRYIWIHVVRLPSTFHYCIVSHEGACYICEDGTRTYNLGFTFKQFSVRSKRPLEFDESVWIKLRNGFQLVM